MNRVLVKGCVTESNVYLLGTFHWKAKLDAEGFWRQRGDGSPFRESCPLGTGLDAAIQFILATLDTLSTPKGTVSLHSFSGCFDSSSQCKA